MQDTDPLRHEVAPLDAARDRVRRTIVGSVPVDGSTKSTRPHLTVVAILAAVAIGVVALAFQLGVNGTIPVHAAVRFEVRLAEDRPIPGLIVAQIADSGRGIYLHPEIVVNNDDIAQSWVLQDGSGYGVGVQFLPSGAERMRQATAGHVGRPLAILIDGAVVLAPVVRSPIITDSAVVTGNYTRSEAERIADGVGTR